ncbi:MAG: hypothetical protein WCC85_03525, partial [Candidatus Sulfotelmatobacter sp.]
MGGALFSGLGAVGLGLALGALSRAFGAGLGLLSGRGSLEGRAFSVRGAFSARGALSRAGPSFRGSLEARELGSGLDGFDGWLSFARGAFSCGVFSRLAPLLFGGTEGRLA